MGTLFLTLALIVGSLMAGYALRRGVEAGFVVFSGSLQVLRQRMQLLALFGCIPCAALLSLWGLPQPDARLLALPLLGVANWVVGGMLALGAAHLLHLNRAQTGSLFCCGTFTNIGALGGLICVLALGERTIALVALYRLCEDVYYFAVGLPVARSFGTAKAGGGKPLYAVLAEPVFLWVLAALGTGFALRWAALPRPAWCGTLASGLVLLATMLFLMGIGMSLRLSHMKVYTRQCLAVACIKFALAPCCITALAWYLGLGAVEGGLPLQVVLVLSSMPVAMNALVPPSLYGLDLDLANTCWLTSTAALVLVLPVVLWLLPLL